MKNTKISYLGWHHNSRICFSTCNFRETWYIEKHEKLELKLVCLGQPDSSTEVNQFVHLIISTNLKSK